MHIYVLIKFLLYPFFWVIPRRLYFMCRRFGTLSYLHSWCNYTTYEDGTDCSKTSKHKSHSPRNNPKERMQDSEHGESLKSRKIVVICELRIPISYIILVNVSLAMLSVASA